MAVDLYTHHELVARSAERSPQGYCTLAGVRGKIKIQGKARADEMG